MRADRQWWSQSAPRSGRGDEASLSQHGCARSKRSASSEAVCATRTRRGADRGRPSAHEPSVQDQMSDDDVVIVQSGSDDPDAHAGRPGTVVMKRPADAQDRRAPKPAASSSSTAGFAGINRYVGAANGLRRANRSRCVFTTSHADSRGLRANARTHHRVRRTPAGASGVRSHPGQRCALLAVLRYR